MRAVKGEVASYKLISLSKAAAVLSRFAASETGVRPEVAAYLRRTGTAFNELVAVHREIRAHRKISPVEEKEGATQDENSRRSMKKKEKKKRKGDYYEGDSGNSKLESKKKMEGLGDEKRFEERRYWKENKRKENRLQEVDGLVLVSESMNAERRKRKHSAAKQGEVNGEMEQQDGKRKNRRNTIEGKQMAVI